jgi:hypothetical protein
VVITSFNSPSDGAPRAAPLEVDDVLLEVDDVLLEVEAVLLEVDDALLEVDDVLLEGDDVDGQQRRVGVRLEDHCSHPHTQRHRHIARE